MTPRVTRRPARVEWLVTIGDTCELSISFVDEAGVPIDLSGRTFTASIDGFAGGATVAAIPVDDSAAAGGVLVLSIDDTTTATLARDVVWWLAEQVGGEPRTLLDGPLRVARRGGAGLGHATNALTVQVTTSSVVVVATAVTGPAGGGGGGGLMAPADILAALVTVDGPGSGLDADTVDGVHAASLATTAALAAHEADTTAIHGIADTSALATGTDVASAIAALTAVYQPLDSDLTAIAALTTTPFGRSLLTAANAAAVYTLLGLGTAATQSITAFDPAGAAAAAQAASQPLDADLTAIAALTTTPFGRAVLALVDAAAARTHLGLGGLATLSTITSAEITDGTIVNADINAAAAIAVSKIAGLATIATSGSATDLVAGTVPTARLGSGTADGTTVLRGDQTWGAVASPWDQRFQPFDLDLAPSGWALHFPRLATATSASVAAAAGDESWTLVHLDKPTTASGLAIYCSAAAASSWARISLYPADASGMPAGSLIEDLGLVDCSSTGAKTANFGSPRTLPTVCWVRILVFGGGPSFYSCANTGFFHFPTPNPFSGYTTSARSCFTRAGVSDGGAAPATVPAGLGFNRYATTVALVSA